MDQCVAIDIEDGHNALSADAPWLGEQMPFEQIVSQHSAMVYSIAFNFFRDVGLAEDISQEAFLKLSMNLGGIKSETHLALWLRRATVRLCIDEYRKFAKRFKALESAPEPVSVHEDEDFLASRRVRELMSKLPKLLRMALVLRFQEDLSPSEIAEIMREPVNTVKSRIKRGLDVLRRKLAPHLSSSAGVTESEKEG
ncbi:MAG: RNA polymerase sigma factor [Holophagales bacterium]|nr:RNA polymerase sigma factor [Holophagales bacterium]